jgi:hypothetical protein
MEGRRHVVIDFKNIPNVNYQSNIFENLILRNFPNISHTTSNTNCVLINCLNRYVIVSTHNRNLYIDSSPICNRQFFNNCIFKNTVINNCQSLAFCYVFKDSSINMTIYNIGNNNCIDGIIIKDSNGYELKRCFDGTARPDADPSIPDLILVDPNCYVNGNFASKNGADIKFLNLLNRTVETDSILLSRNNSDGFIGNVRRGRSIKVNSNTDGTIITFTNIDTSDPENVKIESGFNEGFIDMKFKVSEQITELQAIFLDSLIAFDGSKTGGTADNNNVPDIFPENYTNLSSIGEILIGWFIN